MQGVHVGETIETKPNLHQAAHPKHCWISHPHSFGLFESTSQEVSQSVLISGTRGRCVPRGAAKWVFTLLRGGQGRRKRSQGVLDTPLSQSSYDRCAAVGVFYLSASHHLYTHSRGVLKAFMISSSGEPGSGCIQHTRSPFTRQTWSASDRPKRQHPAWTYRVVVLPAGRLREGHEDALDAAARLEAEDGAAVVHQVELGVPAAAHLLPVLFLLRVLVALVPAKPTHMSLPQPIKHRPAINISGWML